MGAVLGLITWRQAWNLGSVNSDNCKYLSLQKSAHILIPWSREAWLRDWVDRRGEERAATG